MTNKIDGNATNIFADSALCAAFLIKSSIICLNWLLPLPLIWWAAIALAMRWQPGMNLSGLLSACNEMLAQPLPLAWSSQTPRFLLIFTGLYAVIAFVASSEHHNTRPGEEHGSARWGNAKELNRRYRDTQGPNLLMTRNFRIGVDGYKHKHNTNVLVVGGSGAGKTRTYAVPNVLESGPWSSLTPRGKFCARPAASLSKSGMKSGCSICSTPMRPSAIIPFVMCGMTRMCCS